MGQTQAVLSALGSLPPTSAVRYEQEGQEDTRTLETLGLASQKLNRTDWAFTTLCLTCRSICALIKMTWALQRTFKPADLFALQTECFSRSWLVGTQRTRFAITLSGLIVVTTYQRHTDKLDNTERMPYRRRMKNKSSCACQQSTFRYHKPNRHFGLD